MYDDTINNLLKGVADGSITVKDARTALEGVELTEAQMDEAINHGVHNVAESGTIVSASLAPSGGSYLTMFFFAWGIFWSCYWLTGRSHSFTVWQRVGINNNSPSTLL